MKKHNNIIGEKYLTNEGYEIEIIEYVNNRNCTVTFNEAINVKVEKLQYGNIKKGNVKNPFHKSVFGIGYYGINTFNKKDTNKVYSIWNAMMGRCYSNKYKNRQPTYKDITVCDEWHNFSKYIDWYLKNHKENYHVDKDILFKGNKVYSPETCCFVPKEINQLFANSRENVLPIGVHFQKTSEKYIAKISKGCGVREHLGIFDTPEEAFQAYKKVKEAYIKEVADKWKGQITDQVYQAMYNYEIYNKN